MNPEIEEETTVVEEQAIEQVDSGYDSPGTPLSSGSFDSSEYNTANDELDKMELEERLNDIDLDNDLNDKGEIIVEDESGYSSTINVDKSSTISDILKENPTLTENNEDFELISDNRPLPPECTLRDAGIRYKTKLKLREKEVQVFIRRVDGRTSTFSVRRSNTIGQLKEQFFDTDQVPVHQQRLLYQSQELDNTRTLRSYNIRNCSTLESAYRLRGGMME